MYSSDNSSSISEGNFTDEKSPLPRIPKGSVLEESQIPLIRNSKRNFEALERFFGTIETGHAFGNLAMNLD